MTVNCQTVIDLARETLNDDDKTRWPDAECLKYLQGALDALFDLRPDMFHDGATAFATEFDSDALELTTPSAFPIDNRYRRMVADYIIMRCETKDDQVVVTGRAALAHKFFLNQALG